MIFLPKVFPVIDIGSFKLREQQSEDVEEFFRYYTDSEVNKFILAPIPIDLEEARKELSYWRGIFYSREGMYFGIADRATNKLIGSIGFSGISHINNRIELSYDLAKEYWRMGIMSSAIKAVCEYAFSFMSVNRIESFVAIENVPSRILLQKCGFTFEGILREHRFHKGVYEDVCVFSLLRKEFTAN